MSKNRKTKKTQKKKTKPLLKDSDWEEWLPGDEEPIELEGFLRVPLTCVGLHAAAENGLAFVASELQGFRETMEDCHFFRSGFRNFPNLAAAALFDGHGSKTVAALLADKLPGALESFFAEHKERPTNEAVVAFLEEFDQQLLAEELTAAEAYDGSTLVLCLLWNRSELTVFNVGDSRCFAYLPGATPTLTELTADHTPARKDERRRILAAGGFVHSNRVDGELAVSRAFGDAAYKKDTPKVVARAEVREKTLVPGELVFLTCDGFFEQLSFAEVTKFLQKTSFNASSLLTELQILADFSSSPLFEKPREEVLASLASVESSLFVKALDFALESGSMDNISFACLAITPSPELSLRALVPCPLLQTIGEESFLAGYLAFCERYGVPEKEAKKLGLFADLYELRKTQQEVERALTALDAGN